jgi:molecular chaperone GrpE
MSKQGKIVTPSSEEVSAYGGAAKSAGQDEAASPDDRANPAGAGAAPAPESLVERSEADEWRDKFLRAKAELSNYQKRSEKDRSEAMRYAHAELARALLPIADDLERLIRSASEQNASIEALVEGVRLTQENFLKVLEKFHVLPIEAHGQPFDPSVHEALMEQPSEQHADLPVVLHEVTRAITLHDRVLRPSKVIVSKSIALPADQAKSPQ